MKTRRELPRGCQLPLLSMLALCYCNEIGSCFAFQSAVGFTFRQPRVRVTGADVFLRKPPGRSFIGSLALDAVAGTSAESSSVYREDAPPALWPCGDALDKRLLKISLPVIANNWVAPLIGMVDLFWVNQMGDPLAVAGQAAANQVFNSMFWLTSFLPLVTATLISKENASGNKEGVQEAVSHALFVGFTIAALATGFILWSPDRVLSSVLREGAPALTYARPYLVIRAFAVLPSLISLVGFSAFRGVMDTVTPVKISLFANLFNAVFDPLLIFTLAMGVPGAAIATLAAEIVSAVVYLVLMKKRALLSSIRKVFRPPPWRKLEPLLKGGAALQLRNVALNLTFLLVTRVVQSIDETGVAAAAHALSIQTFQVGGIFLLSLSTVAQTMVPNDLYEGGKEKAKATVNRLMRWGLLLGIGLSLLQLAMVPLIQRSSPLQEVRQASRAPAILSCLLQVTNGLVFIGEGVMIGTGNFMQLSISTIIATAGCILALTRFPSKYGLTGVWLGFCVWNFLRLIGVSIYHFINGPLAARNMDKKL